MFIISKDSLLEVIHKMQRKSCGYDMYSCNKDSKQPSFCDCKFGFDDKQYGEQTGCPELRCVLELLTLITYKEYEEIMSREHHIML